MDKNYTCEECEMTFYGNGRKKNYDRHLEMVHAREKKFKCYFCNKLFYDGRHRTNHQKEKHPDLNPLTCYSCDYTFKSVRNIDYHHILIHKNNP